MSRPLRIALAFVGVATPLAVGWFVPVAEGPPLCTFRNLTGYDCPGCGLTRSVVGFLHGDVAGSLRAHPLGVAIFVAGMVLWGSALVAWARGGRLISPVGAKTPTWAFVVFFALYLGVYALRLAGLLGGTADPPAEGIVFALWR
jgi:hypothetical protein